MSKIGLKHLNAGDSFIGFCIIRKKELRHKQNGQPYLDLELGDFSGRLKAKVWDKAKETYVKVHVGQIIKVKGSIQTFLNKNELHIERWRIAREDEYKLEELIPSSEKNVTQLKSRLQHHINSIENIYLNKLITKLFPDETFLDKYLISPSGKLWHHNYLYGTLEHLVCLLDLADILIIHYPSLNKDLLKCGILLHDVGKQIGYNQEGYIDFSLKGRLIGHTVLGYQMVQKAIQSIDNFPDDLNIQLSHLILSHQGKGEKGSPVVPMTFEAMALNLLDELDGQINAVQRIIKYDKMPDSPWSRFNNLLERFIYIGDKSENQDTNKQND